MGRPSGGETPWRNWGCRAREVTIEGIAAVVLENKRLRVTILAGKGAEIHEFLYKPLDLDVLYHGFRDLRSYQGAIASAPDNLFFDRYIGGWQTLFPAIGDSGVQLPERIPFHGEAALLPWDYQIEKNEEDEVRVRFSLRTKRFPFLLEKDVSLKNEAASLWITDRITNLGGEALSYEYGQHPALGSLFLDENCEIRLPEGQYTVVPDPATDLMAGETTIWPEGRLKDGTRLDLRRVLAAKEKHNLEFGLAGLKRGEVEIRNHRLSVGFGLSWDIGQLPFLWIWEPDNASMGYPFYGGAYCLGVEPWSNLPSFSPMKETREKGKLDPGETKEYAFLATITEYHENGR